jgi:N-acetylmuramoyl-L-alanine amidase
MANIYISPSSQPANTYAYGNTNEQEQCRKIATALKKELDRCGFNSKAGLSGTMYSRVYESNEFGADLHLPIHTNACDGKVAGLRIFVYKKGGEAEKIAKAIDAELAPITPGTSDGISAQPQLYEVKNSKGLCVYIEVGFHDNKEEAKWIIEHTQEIAVAIAKGLCKHYGVKYVAVSKPAATKPAESDVFYRVQVGAYNEKANAENMLKKLKAAGFEGFIVEVKK